MKSARIEELLRTRVEKPAFENLRHIAPGRFRLERRKMNARDIMTPTPCCTTTETTLPEVARLMVEHDCGAIPIIEDSMGKQVVGIITDRDIVCRTLAERRNPMDLRARDVMTPNVATVSSDSSIEEVCRTMEQRQVRREPRQL